MRAYGELVEMRGSLGERGREKGDRSTTSTLLPPSLPPPPPLLSYTFAIER